jgi:thiol-disulfide isomerase/thioredoxin
MKTLLFLAFALFSCTSISAQNVKNFQLKDLENKTRNYNELKGDKLTLIDFWATWCAPCYKAIPELNIIYDQYKAKGVEMIGINVDGPRSLSKVKPLSKSLGIEYPVLMDINSDITTELNILTFPTLLIVDARNKVVWIHEGFVAGDEKIIIKELDRLLKLK